ncbi:M15 family metallopeptidase [Dyadobacter aurulentus]|uniref:M15 family metallopeptidase n=1 Tax=Dyadobacter sp. UC 10 TaxID=2605428 RepID=UPI0011F16717|nr:M15 family metallopeptidase [Dyadobacter sp. UC 10]KAA0991550.1 M15 family metallopeptidase [Dyadobacter sp. UC 10]
MSGKINKTLVLLLLQTSLFAQKQELPKVEQSMIAQGLVNIRQVDPGILVELKYSTTDNFLKKDIYGDLDRAYLQPEMAKRLAKANAMLAKEKPGYKLLVYDAARPNSAQYALWDALDDLKIPAGKKTMYVADPKIGSNHNFGCAIDLTVADENGKPLDMGTKFDFFGPLAYPRSEQEMLKKGKLTTKQIENRQLLRKVMVQAGFRVNTTEWWHFDGMSKSQARAKYGMIK